MNFEIILLFAADVFLTAFNDMSALILGFFAVAIVFAAAVKIVLFIRA